MPFIAIGQTTAYIQLHDPDPGVGSGFGIAVAISGDHAFVSESFSEPGSLLPGHERVHVFYRHEGGMNAWGWKQTLTAPDGDDIGFGLSLSAENGRLAVHQPSHGVEYFGLYPLRRSRSCIYEMGSDGSWDLSFANAAELILDDGWISGMGGSHIELSGLDLLMSGDTTVQDTSIIANPWIRIPRLEVWTSVNGQWQYQRSFEGGLDLGQATLFMDHVGILGEGFNLIDPVTGDSVFNLEAVWSIDGNGGWLACRRNGGFDIYNTLDLTSPHPILFQGPVDSFQIDSSIFLIVEDEWGISPVIHIYAYDPFLEQWSLHTVVSDISEQYWVNASDVSAEGSAIFSLRSIDASNFDPSEVRIVEVFSPTGIVEEEDLSFLSYDPISDVYRLGCGSDMERPEFFATNVVGRKVKIDPAYDVDHIHIPRSTLPLGITIVTLQKQQGKCHFKLIGGH